MHAGRRGVRIGWTAAAIVAGAVAWAWPHLPVHGAAAQTAAAAAAAAPLSPCRTPAPCKRVLDMAGALPRADLPRFEDYLAWMARESGVDVRIVFVSGIAGRRIEDAAVQAVEQLGIGASTGRQRGLLLLADTATRTLKVEVGYGLEGMFPDAFVGYLMHEHAALFFGGRDLSGGLRLLLRLLQQRIREAVLGNAFDPRVVQAVADTGSLSGGAGATLTLPPTPAPVITPMSQAQRSRFPAGETPEATYARYLAWLAQPGFDPQVPLFTAGSQRYLAGFPASVAYRHFILFSEYGQPHRVEQRGDLALLYFTATPFASPHFFVRQDGRWQMDMQAEVRNTAEHVGTHYTWTYRGLDDNYSTTFEDLFVQLGPFRRFKDGDNRKLRMAAAA